MNAIPQPNLIKRRIVYIDDSVQKWLLVALVALEVLLVAGALWALYLQLSNVVDANLYRVHLADKPRIYPLLLKTALVGLSGLVAINIVVLLIADRIWARHVSSILHPFMQLVGRVAALDLREDPPVGASHQVIELARAWRKTERQRLLKLRAEIAKLETLGDLSNPGTKEPARAALAAIQKLLP